MTNLYVSPSSFGFLADECPRCYCNEVHGLKKRPRLPFPAIFSQIDSAMKTHLSYGTFLLDQSLPAMAIVAQGRRVVSHPIAVAGTNVNLIIRGNYDSLVRFDDGTLGVVDWKTTRVRPDLVAKYGRSLHAYAYAMENPASGAARNIRRLGLGVFEPSRFAFAGSGAARLDGGFSWIAVHRDDDQFGDFMARIGRLLAAPIAPPPDSQCSFCAYVEAA